MSGLRACQLVVEHKAMENIGSKSGRLERSLRPSQHRTFHYFTLFIGLTLHAKTDWHIICNVFSELYTNAFEGDVSVSIVLFLFFLAKHCCIHSPTKISVPRDCKKYFHEVVNHLYLILLYFVQIWDGHSLSSIF